MKSTIKQVAELAGVSTATISKYLNGVTVKHANKIAIDDAIKRLNYQINPSARGLRTNKTMTVGVLLPELDNLFMTSVVSNIENVLMKHGYSTIICDYKTNKRLEKDKLNFLLARNVDAIVWIPTYANKKMLKEINTPVVFIDRIVTGTHCTSVTIDNIAASYEAVDHMIKKGHTDIAILCGPTNVSTSNERLQGYFNALQDNGLTTDERFVQRGEYTEQSGFFMTNQVLDMEHRPTAIFATNNELTIGALCALAERDIDIPNDISFVGFDSEMISKVTRPKLTVVLQPLKDIGENAAVLVLKMIKGEDEVHTVKLNSIFLEQNSVTSLTK